MDIRTRFFLDCWKQKVGLSKKTFSHTNLRDEDIYSLNHNITLMNGGIYITKGKAKNTWCAVYQYCLEDNLIDTVELVFDKKPNVEDVEFIRFLLAIEDFFTDSAQKPYVYFNQRKTHWTLLPFNSVEDKWRTYLYLRKKPIQLSN